MPELTRFDFDPDGSSLDIGLFGVKIGQMKKLLDTIVEMGTITEEDSINAEGTREISINGKTYRLVEEPKPQGKRNAKTEDTLPSTGGRPPLDPEAVKSKILDSMKGREGTTIKTITSQIGHSRNNISEFMNQLESEGKIRVMRRNEWGGREFVLAGKEPVIKCNFCESEDAVFHSHRQTERRGMVKIYFCNSCERKFTPRKYPRSRFPEDIRDFAINSIDKSTREISDMILEEFGEEVSPMTISRWKRESENAREVNHGHGAQNGRHISQPYDNDPYPEAREKMREFINRNRQERKEILIEMLKKKPMTKKEIVEEITGEKFESRYSHLTQSIEPDFGYNNDIFVKVGEVVKFGRRAVVWGLKDGPRDENERDVGVAPESETEDNENSVQGDPEEHNSGDLDFNALWKLVNAKLNLEMEEDRIITYDDLERANICDNATDVWSQLASNNSPLRLRLNKRFQKVIRFVDMERNGERYFVVFEN